MKTLVLCFVSLIFLLILSLSGAYSWTACMIISIATLLSIGFAIKDSRGTPKDKI